MNEKIKSLIDLYENLLKKMEKLADESSDYYTQGIYTGKVGTYKEVISDLKKLTEGDTND